MDNSKVQELMAAHVSSLGPSPTTVAEYVEMLSKHPTPRRLDKTSLSYWFPMIEKAGLPVPKTEVLTMPLESQAIIWMAFDGRGEGQAAPVEPFYDDLKATALRLGLPCFLRTCQTSAKHQWSRTCFIESVDCIRQHVFEIAKFSECADMMGLPWETWVVREFLPIIPHGLCPRCGNMPVNREFRFFVDGENVKCFHPYWPLEALSDGGWQSDAQVDIAYANLCNLTIDEETEIRILASRAGAAVGGAWSVDILETEKGWYVTDMAEAHKSFHWEGCPKP
jgi:hypothetical protein